MMEFEEEHEEQEEEEEEEEEEMAITPTLKNHQHHQQQQQQQPKARYRECLKNHAVSIGGRAVDGCGEFLPAGTDGTLDALRCAACNCHRNFHRKEFLIENNSPSSQLTLYTPRPHHQVYQFYPYNRTTAGYLHVSGQRPLPLPSPPGNGLKGHGRAESLNINNNNNNDNNNNNGSGSGGTMMMSGGGNSTTSSGKKRFRTKFSGEQKDKMLVLAERLGWRIQKQDEEIVQQFCNETGVKRQVLKVWMHNNKHTLGKKP